MEPFAYKNSQVMLLGPRRNLSAAPAGDHGRVMIEAPILLVVVQPLMKSFGDMPLRLACVHVAVVLRLFCTQSAVGSRLRRLRVR